MNVPASDTDIEHVFLQFFTHSFCQSSYQYTLFALSYFVYFFQQIIYLINTWAYLYNRVKQSCRTNYLLCNYSFAPL